MVFDGTTSSVRILASTNLNVGAGSGLTIETWINPRNTSTAQPLVEWNSGASGFNGIGSHLWIGVDGPGSIWVNLIDSSLTPHALSTTNGLVVTNSFQHVATTYDKGTGFIRLYLNGAKVAETNLGTFLPNTTADVYFGLRPAAGGGPNRYNGLLDEVSIYNRALTVPEIRSIVLAGSFGKCGGGFPPIISKQPTNQTVTVGGTATFSVVAGGSPILAYAWKFNSNAPTIGTNSTLTLTNVQPSQAGSYAVQISNSVGSTNSSNAVLTVVIPPTNVRVVGTNSAAANNVTVPIQIVANGNENGVSFSLNYTNTVLNYVTNTLGSGAVGAFLSVNTNSIPSGKLGFQIVLPPNTTFNAGTQEVVRLLFGIPAVTNATSASLSFGDSPITRQITDTQFNPLSATYSNGTVVVAAALALEGDLSPRTNGDKMLTLSDWFLTGQFVAGLIAPTNASEFQRIDCAPRSTFGDGQLSTCDWVQAGRYANGLDPATPIGGPSAVVSNTSAGPSASRLVSVTNATIIQGQTGAVSVLLAAQGNENALGFSLNFNPAQYGFSNVSLGSGTAGGLYIINTNNIGSGQLGVLVTLPSGSTFAAGATEIFKVTLQALPGSPNASTSALSFSDQPVFREISDALASPLPASYSNATLTTHPQRPTLQIAPSGTNIIVTWPLWATNFGLAVAPGALPPVAQWTNLNLTPVATSNGLTVTLTNDGGTNYFRLHNP